MSGGRTLAVAGDLREMSTEFLRGVYYEGYGVSLFVGLGVPIPVLDEEMAWRVSVRNEDIETLVVDYGRGNEVIGRTNYAALQSGEIEVGGRRVRTAPVASLAKAREVARVLKGWIEAGEFELTAPVRPMPTGTRGKGLEIKGFDDEPGI